MIVIGNDVCSSAILYYYITLAVHVCLSYLLIFTYIMKSSIDYIFSILAHFDNEKKQVLCPLCFSILYNS
jgi:hypothetical protein